MVIVNQINQHRSFSPQSASFKASGTFPLIYSYVQYL